MLDSIRFVQGAVAKKDFSPELTHFHIEDHKIKGFNGSMALCGPIELDLNVTPKATPFVKAIRTCKKTISLHVGNNGKLVVKSGSFKAFIDCSEEAFPVIEPEGELIEIPSGVLGVLKKLAPFVADDASRPWACGILFRGQSAFATNNACLVEHWLESPFPFEVCIPQKAIAEILRIKEEPVAIQVSESNMTFHFAGDRWLRCQMLDTEWPDIASLLNKESNQTPIPEGFHEAVEDLSQFGDEISRLYFLGDKISTTPSGIEGAIVEVAGMPEEGCFSAQFLCLLKGVATTFDMDAYPKPCAFFGDKIRGVMMGVRE
jgi:DNA polymerase III sliding clamp (beta) subunit (PCNA family)